MSYNKKRMTIMSQIVYKGLNKTTVKDFTNNNAVTYFLSFTALALPYTISGNWHLFPNEVGKSVDAKCVQFSAVDEKVN